MNLSAFTLGIVLLAGILTLPGPVLATLGEGADSVEKDRTALSASRHAMASHAKYTVQEVATEATTVREYLTPSGAVFAVAWDGLVHPDLTTLLGTYAGEYRDAKRQTQRKHGQRRLRVQSSSVIVETWGHMRSLRGRAYLPALVPEGVSVDEIN
jgi:hypothetical protein